MTFILWLEKLKFKKNNKLIPGVVKNKDDLLQTAIYKKSLKPDENILGVLILMSLIKLNSFYSDSTRLIKYNFYLKIFQNKCC